MKSSNILLILVFTIVSLGASALPLQEASSVEFEKYKKHQVSLKINKALLGAEVFVYHESGDLVTIERLSKKKLIIDFQKAKAGTYIILVKKSHFSEEFTYSKDPVLKSRNN